MVTPRGWQDEFAVFEGATFNLAHNLTQMLYFRPHNRFGRNVYLVGGGTHPGSGLPVIYEGARITTRLLLEDLASKPAGTPHAACHLGTGRRSGLMGERTGMLRLAIVVAAFVAAASGQAATLVIRAEGVGSAQGMVYAGICDTSFEEATCPYKDRGRRPPGVVEFRVRNVKPGPYAIAVFHDLNGNGKLDRNFIGLPSEPYGFSNDVGRRGIPNFDGAQVVVTEPSTAILVPIR